MEGYKYFLIPYGNHAESYEVSKEEYWQVALEHGYDLNLRWRNAFRATRMWGKIIYAYGDKTCRMFPPEGLEKMSSAKEQFLREIENQGNVDEVTRMHAAYKAMGEDTYSSGTIVRTLKVFPDSGNWWYAAIKGNDGKWRMTGGKPRVEYPGGVTWHQLKVWLASTGYPTTSLEVFGDDS